MMFDQGGLGVSNSRLMKQHVWTSHANQGRLSVQTPSQGWRSRYCLAREGSKLCIQGDANSRLDDLRNVVRSCTLP